jgi:hypothetical protein
LNKDILEISSLLSKLAPFPFRIGLFSASQKSAIPKGVISGRLPRKQVAAHQTQFGVDR